MYVLLLDYQHYVHMYNFYRIKHQFATYQFLILMIIPIVIVTQIFLILLTKLTNPGKYCGSFLRNFDFDVSNVLMILII